MKPSRLPDWDKDTAVLFDNLSRISQSVYLCASQRIPPTKDLACQWHRSMMQGLNVPNEHMVATFRGGPGLENCFVRIGSHQRSCVHPNEVDAALSVFFENFVSALDQLDREEQRRDPSWDEGFLAKLLKLMAWVHTRWIAIHPFANGNGRIARLWVNYIAQRYGLPPFLALRPRPSAPYTQKCAQAISSGDWRVMVEVFDEMLDEFLDEFGL